MIELDPRKYTGCGVCGAWFPDDVSFLLIRHLEEHKPLWALAAALRGEKADG